MANTDMAHGPLIQPSGGITTDMTMAYKPFAPSEWEGNYMNTCVSENGESAKYFVLEDTRK